MGTPEGLQALGEIASVGLAAETAMNRLQSMWSQVLLSENEVSGHGDRDMMTPDRVGFYWFRSSAGVTWELVEARIPEDIRIYSMEKQWGGVPPRQLNGEFIFIPRPAPVSGDNGILADVDV